MPIAFEIRLGQKDTLKGSVFARERTSRKDLLKQNFVGVLAALAQWLIWLKRSQRRAVRGSTFLRKGKRRSLKEGPVPDFTRPTGGSLLLQPQRKGDVQCRRGLTRQNIFLRHLLKPKKRRCQEALNCPKIIKGVLRKQPEGKPEGGGGTELQESSRKGNLFDAAPVRVCRGGGPALQMKPICTPGRGTDLLECEIGAYRQWGTGGFRP